MVKILIQGFGVLIVAIGILCAPVLQFVALAQGNPRECALKPPPGSNDIEVRHWHDFCVEGRISMDEWNPESNQWVCPKDELFLKSSDSIAVEERTIRASFLRKIITNRDLAKILPLNNVRLSCLRIEGNLNLNYARLPRRLEILRSYVTGSLDLRDARINGSISLNGSKIDGPINLESTEVDGHVDIREGFFGRINMNRITTTGGVWIGNASLTDELTAYQAKIGGSIYFKEGKFEKINLSDAKLGGGVFGYNASVSGSLNLRQITTRLEINLNSVAANTINMSNSKIGTHLTLDGLDIVEGVNFSDAQIGTNVYMRNGARIKGAISAAGASIGGEFGIKGAQVGGNIFLRQSDIADDLYISNSIIKGQINAPDISIGGNISVSRGSQIESGLTLERAHVRGLINVGDDKEDGVTYLKYLVLRDARIQGQLGISYTKILENINASGLRVAGFTELKGVNANKAKFGDATISGYFQISNSRIDTLDISYANLRGGFGTLNASILSNLSLAGTRTDGPVLFKDSQISQKLNLGGIKLDSSLSFRGGSKLNVVNLDNARISGPVSLHGSEFTGPFSAKYAKLGSLALWKSSNINELSVVSGSDTGEEKISKTPSVHHDVPIWRDAAKLDLTSLEIGTLILDIKRSFVLNGDNKNTDVPRSIVGFTYQTMEEPTSTVDDQERVRLFVDWIEKSGSGFAFNPQPYRQLESLFRARGAEPLADEITYQRFVHRAQTQSGIEWAVAQLQRWLVGFGVYPQWALLWFFGLVLSGSLVAKLSAPWKDKGFLDSFWYSLENSIPLIELSAEHQSTRHPNTFARSFFHFQKVSGFVLATVLVGALTVLGG